MLQLLIFCATIAVACNIYVRDLVNINGGLLWFIEKVYPYPDTFFGKLLRCDMCLSGWLSMLFYPFFVFGTGWAVDVFTIVFLPVAAFWSMAINKTFNSIWKRAQ